MKRLARSRLYAMVWSRPLTHLAKEFDISDVGLAKVCRKHDIPLPGLGHWAKVAAGKKVKTIPLPHPEDDSQIDAGERSPTLRALYAQKREWASCHTSTDSRPEGNSADWFYLIRKMVENEDPRIPRIEKLVRLNEREPSEIDWVPRQEERNLAGL